MAVERTRTTAQATAEGLRVFVAGVPWKVDEDILRRDFEECGIIEDLFLMRDEEGWSKGRAFITFRDKEAAEAALRYDSTDYGGRKIFVKVASQGKKRPEESTPSSEPKPKKGPKPEEDFPEEKPEGCVSLCLKNLGEEVSQNQVREFLSNCRVQSVRLVADRVTGTPRGIAFVDFPHTSEVDKAMLKNGQEFNGKAVEMRYEKPRQRPRPDGCLAVAVKKLGPKTREADIRNLFKGLNSLSEVRVICNPDRTCNGLAFAEFTSEKDVEAAVKRDGMNVRGHTVFICYETKQKKERPKSSEQADDGDEPAADERPARKGRTPGGKEKKRAKQAGAGEEAAPEGAGEPAPKRKAKRKRAGGQEQEEEPPQAPATPAKGKKAKRRRGEAGEEGEGPTPEADACEEASRQEANGAALGPEKARKKKKRKVTKAS